MAEQESKKSGPPVFKSGEPLSESITGTCGVRVRDCSRLLSTQEILVPFIAGQALF